MTDATPTKAGDAAPSVADLGTYLKADPADPLLPRVIEAATALIDEHLTDADLLKVVPATVRRLAVQEVAADLYHRRYTRNGIASFDGPDLTPLRVTRDPVKAAADILRPYRRIGIA